MAPGSGRGAWLRSLRPGAPLRLLCFAHSGAGASLFRQWPAHLPDHVDVCPVQLPGREDRLREPPLDSLRSVLDALSRELPELDHYALFGQSVGALIAFELARTLRDLGRPEPSVLVVAGAGAPDCPDRAPPIADMTDVAFIEHLRGLQGTPEIVLRNDELMRLLLPATRADFRIFERYVYRPGPPLSCPILALGGTEDVHVQPSRIERWRRHTHGGFRRRIFPGGHFFVEMARHEVLGELSSALSEVRKTRTTWTL